MVERILSGRFIPLTAIRSRSDDRQLPLRSRSAHMLCTRCRLPRLKFTTDFGLGSAPDPADTLSFPYFFSRSGFNYDFITYDDFISIAASNTATNDVPN